MLVTCYVCYQHAMYKGVPMSVCHRDSIQQEGLEAASQLRPQADHTTTLGQGAVAPICVAALTCVLPSVRAEQSWYPLPPIMQESSAACRQAARQATDQSVGQSVGQSTSQSAGNCLIQ